MLIRLLSQPGYFCWHRYGFRLYALDTLLPDPGPPDKTALETATR